MLYHDGEYWIVPAERGRKKTFSNWSGPMTWNASPKNAPLGFAATSASIVPFRRSIPFAHAIPPGSSRLACPRWDSKRAVSSGVRGGSGWILQFAGVIGTSMEVADGDAWAPRRAPTHATAAAEMARNARRWEIGDKHISWCESGLPR